MRERSIWNNIFSIEQKKIKYQIMFLLFSILLLVVLFLFGQFPLQKIETVKGTYLCEEKCVLNIIVPLEISKEIKTTQEIILNGKKQLLKGVEFGKIEFLKESNIAIQNLILEVSEKDYYNYQTIEVQLILEQETLFQALLRSMKGGDA